MQSEKEYNKEYLTTSASTGIGVKSPTEILQILNQEEEGRYVNGLDTFKLTRQQMRNIFKSQKMSVRIKQLTNVKYV